MVRHKSSLSVLRMFYFLALFVLFHTQCTQATKRSNYLHDSDNLNTLAFSFDTSGKFPPLSLIPSYQLTLTHYTCNFRDHWRFLEHRFSISKTGKCSFSKFNKGINKKLK